MYIQTASNTYSSEAADDFELRFLDAVHRLGLPPSLAAEDLYAKVKKLSEHFIVTNPDLQPDSACSGEYVYTI